MKRTAIAAAALIALLASVWLSSPSTVVIDEELTIQGPINRARAFIQGERFWLNQRHLVEKELAWYAAAPERAAAVDAAMERSDEAVKRAEASMEKVYDRMPEARPTQAQQEAAALRKLASHIEANEAQRLIDEIAAKRIVRLRLILSALAQREQ